MRLLTVILLGLYFLFVGSKFDEYVYKSDSVFSDAGGIYFSNFDMRSSLIVG